MRNSLSLSLFKNVSKLIQLLVQKSNNTKILRFLLLPCRNYYRCTHKYDQKCKATKQVQRIQEEPPLYKTTYFDHHTCNDLFLNSDEIIHDSNNSPNDTSIFLSFNNTFPNPTKQECPFLSPSSVNRDEQIPSSSSDDHHYLISPEPTLDDSSRHNNVTLSPDHWDVMSAVLCDDDVYQYHPFVGF